MLDRKNNGSPTWLSTEQIEKAWIAPLVTEQYEE